MPTNSLHLMLARLRRPISLGLGALILDSSFALAQSVVDPSFETSTLVPGFTNTPGVWFNPDGVAITDGVQQGITPRTGSRMLRYDTTTWTSPGASLGSELLQLIDLSDPASQAAIATGNAVLTTVAYFNRVAGDPETDTEFAMRLSAYDGSISGFTNAWFGQTHLAWNVGRRLTDADLATWQPLCCKLYLPQGTTYVALDGAAVENVFNDLIAPEFDGHYADDFFAAVTIDPLAAASYCSVTVNSAGTPAVISALGSTRLANNNFHVVVSGLPPSVYGVLFYGDYQTESPLGNGLLCVAGTAHHINPLVTADLGGVATRHIDFSTLPAPIVAYSQWNFQLWYRDVSAGGARSNLSNGLCATFRP